MRSRLISGCRWRSSTSAWASWKTDWPNSSRRKDGELPGDVLEHIPSQVNAWEGDAKAKRMLPDYFQAAIDAYAMKDGSTDMDAYLEGWRRGPIEQRAGTPEEVIDALVA